MRRKQGLQAALELFLEPREVLPQLSLRRGPVLHQGRGGLQALLRPHQRLRLLSHHAVSLVHGPLQLGDAGASRLQKQAQAVM